VRRVKPTTAANHAKVTVARHVWRAIWRRVFIALARAILNPLPDISEHVTETEGVRRKATCWRGMCHRSAPEATGAQQRSAPVLARSWDANSPQGLALLLPARAAYSHSASDR